MLTEGNLHNSYIFVKFTLFLTCGVDGNRGLGLRLAVPTDDNEARLPSLPGWTRFDCSEESSVLSEDTAFSFQTYSSVSWTCCVLGTRVGRPPHLEKAFIRWKVFFTRGVGVIYYVRSSTRSQKTPSSSIIMLFMRPVLIYRKCFRRWWKRGQQLFWEPGSSHNEHFTC